MTLDIADQAFYITVFCNNVQLTLLL